jgi:hypothetical protein
VLHRFSWGFFVVIGAMGLIVAAQMLFDPSSVSMLGHMGQDTSPLTAPEARGLLAFLSRWIGLSFIGGNLFTVGIAVTALRRGERWAVVLMLYWPFTFLSHFLMYGPGPMRAMQLVWLALSTAAIAVQLFRRSGSSRAPGVGS